MNDDHDAFFAHLLEDPRAILNDLAETEEKLHSTESVTRGAPTVTAGIRRRTVMRTAIAPKVTLASRLKEHRDTIREFSNASETKRTELIAADPLRLRSIIFAEYRPAPTYNTGHILSSGTLQQKVKPGGATWASLIPAATHGHWARQTVRLDNSAGIHRGSGTLFPDGRILTAAHVIEEPGYMFGEPPAQQTTGMARLNCLTGGGAMDLALQGFAIPGALDFAWLNASAEWPAKLTATEFAALPGLPLQTTAPAFSLPGRQVAIIGHPGPPPAGSADAALAPKVYNDAPYGMKRFMPGILHPTNPLVTKNGISYLRHDCSTLGGASGSVLIDLATGVVLGVHVSGKLADGSEDRNLAVPAWTFNGVPPPLT